MDDFPVNTTSTKLAKAMGPPKGSRNAMRHGLYYFKRLVSGDSLKKSTALYHALAEKELELINALGGDPSPQERALLSDSVKNMLYIGSPDNYLLTLKSLIRKSRPHPVLAIRTQMSAHLRENLKTLGLKRIPRELAPSVIKVTANEIRFTNASTIKVIARDYRGAAGGRWRVASLDEVWGFNQENAVRLFEELRPPPTEPGSYLFITSLAGFSGESTVLEKLYERAMRDRHANCLI